MRGVDGGGVEGSVEVVFNVFDGGAGAGSDDGGGIEEMLDAGWIAWADKRRVTVGGEAGPFVDPLVASTPSIAGAVDKFTPTWTWRWGVTEPTE